MFLIAKVSKPYVHNDFRIANQQKPYADPTQTPRRAYSNRRAGGWFMTSNSNTDVGFPTFGINFLIPDVGFPTFGSNLWSQKKRSMFSPKEVSALSEKPYIQKEIVHFTTSILQSSPTRILTKTLRTKGKRQFPCRPWLITQLLQICPNLTYTRFWRGIAQRTLDWKLAKTLCTPGKRLFRNIMAEHLYTSETNTNLTYRRKSHMLRLD
jgi:hypothetical protein